MIVDKFVNELKEIVSKKNELISKKKELQVSLKRGEQYFSSLVRNPNAKALNDGAVRALEIMTEYQKIEDELKDLDIIAIAKIEAYTMDIIAKCNIPEHLNDAGDLISTSEVFLVPFKTDSDLVEIAPDDIWFLKLAKQALKATNVEFIKKGE